MNRMDLLVSPVYPVGPVSESRVRTLARTDLLLIRFQNGFPPFMYCLPILFTFRTIRPWSLLIIVVVASTFDDVMLVMTIFGRKFRVFPERRPNQTVKTALCNLL